MGDRLIVYQAPWNWDWLRTRAQPLAEALADRAHVLYLDNGIAEGWGDPVSRLLGRSVTARYGIQHRLVHGFRVAHLSDRLDRVVWRGLGPSLWSGLTRDRPAATEWAFGRWLRRYAAGFDRVWLLTSRPPIRRLVRHLRWDRVVVDIEDPWVEMSWAERLGTAAMRALLAQADVVTANGQAVADVMQSLCPIPIHNLPNGVDGWLVDAVTGPPLAAPDFYRPAGRPRAVFTGAINNRLDYAALSVVADRASGC
ncbi:MAG: hypothetical protein ACRC7O_17400, partial [Fimbriiglobus sp.]